MTRRYGALKLASACIAAVLLLIILIPSCSKAGVWVSNRIYPALTAPQDREPPSTFMIHPPSTQLSAFVGGQGGGISCSIPGLIKPAFFSSEGNLGDVNLRFRQACAMHDLCYRHGEATYGYSQADCDFALLDSAFRICAIAFKDEVPKASVAGTSPTEQGDTNPAVNLTHGAAIDNTSALMHSVNKKCADQARLVLLGVRVGGGDSFQTGENSTYIEYDPSPAKANDYTTVLWKSSRQPLGAFLGEFYYFHHQNGRITPKQLPAGPHTHQTYALPKELIPTPPTVIDGDGGDELVILARNSAASTWLAAYKLDLSSERPEVKPVPYGTYDPESTVAWISSNDRPILNFWRRYDATVRSCEIKGSTNCVNPQKSQAMAIFSDTYRTLQHPPLHGRFLGGTCEYYAVPRRGTKELRTGQSADSGKGFEEYLALLLAPANPNHEGCKSGTGSTHIISESLEPLGVLAMGPDHADMLIGFGKLVPGDYQSTLEAQLLSLESPGEVLNLRFSDPVTLEPLDGEWIKHPAAVVRPDVLGNPNPYIVLTRIKAEEDMASAPPRSSDTDFSTRFLIQSLAFDFGDRDCKGSRCTVKSKVGVSCQFSGTRSNFVRLASGLALPGIFFNQSEAPRTPPLQLAVLPKGKSAGSFVTALRSKDENEPWLATDLASAMPIPSSLCTPYDGRRGSDNQFPQIY